ncbi:NAD(P)/FAD-dependent oxidoreductase [Mesorhizobium sp. M7A.F.Ca.US.006.01.1.1]|uniref:flavin-containing monooxygenase n=1 Tax=Mesorhizobium sp. M7A.F.Ca.US.006.01.1.1 TaxID=2496707 RepID=UPI000FCAD138|nr:NAD(P)/FAD-dependent oxidoreductase [Mesorhizobium sp. M7A.F.Ca.US.006.01.1.1]RUZ77966.1 NAD(P)/FAD-dependent oxidoreductase [Mesorhizobium sp. M7A.F.Ca.US.006.01.1.1]
MSDSITKTHDVVIVGAGFAGLYALYRMKEMGLSAIVLERGDGIGGTWHWNRYPGARCDVESLQYSYSFSDEVQQEWKWSERFASQGEILRYIHFVADKFGLRKFVELNTGVVAATYDDDDAMWTTRTADGRLLRTRYIIFATGCLSVPIEPDIPGLDRFAGNIYRTSTWPKTPVDFTGRRVAVVGTGSSGIQAVPVIALEARHLFVLQRTPNYSIPGRNSPMDQEYEADWKRNYAQRRQAALQTRSSNLFNAGTIPGREVSAEDREREFERRWEAGGLGFTYCYPDITMDPDVNKHASEFVRRKVAQKVKDPKVAASLVPTEYGIGGRRLCVDNGYYETFNRDNVTMVDLRNEPLLGMTQGGFATQRGEYEIDDLVLATGFDAFTGALNRIDVRGRAGVSLREKWADGPANYLGLTVTGFPNMFTVTGPGSPSVLSNVVISIQQHVDWITECLEFLRQHGRTTIEAKPESEEAWGRHIAGIAEGTLISKTKSWYTGTNVTGKTNRYFLYMGGTVRYLQEINQAGRESGYSGFTIG